MLIPTAKANKISEKITIGRKIRYPWNITLICFMVGKDPIFILNRDNIVVVAIINITRPVIIEWCYKTIAKYKQTNVKICSDISYKNFIPNGSRPWSIKNPTDCLLTWKIFANRNTITNKPLIWKNKNVPKRIIKNGTKT